MSPVGSNMRAGSRVLSTKEVSTTSEGDDDDNDDVPPPPPPPPPLVPLLPKAARPTVTAITQPDASDRCSRMGPSPFTNRQTFPPMCAAGQGRSVSTAKRVCDS